MGTSAPFYFAKLLKPGILNVAVLIEGSGSLKQGFSVLCLDGFH